MISRSKKVIENAFEIAVDLTSNAWIIVTRSENNRQGEFKRIESQLIELTRRQMDFTRTRVVAGNFRETIVLLWIKIFTRDDDYLTKTTKRRMNFISEKILSAKINVSYFSLSKRESRLENHVQKMRQKMLNFLFFRFLFLLCFVHLEATWQSALSKSRLLETWYFERVQLMQKNALFVSI